MAHNVISLSLATFHSPISFLRTSSQAVSELCFISTKANSNHEIPHEFLSDEMQVYIEDTDAYSVIYNGNYLRMYERALQLSGYLTDPHWYINSVTRHRFKSSPNLGDKFRIHGERCSPSTWNLRMLDCSTPTHKEGMEKTYNTAQVTVHIPTAIKKLPTTNSSVPSESLSGGSVSTIDTFILHRDELVVTGLTPTYLGISDNTIALQHILPLRSVLNLFERARSNFLGGPNILRQMKTDNNLLWVVTSIDGLILHDRINELKLLPGQAVAVKTDATTKRRGMIVEFHQTVEIIEENRKISPHRGDTRIASGIVTICAIDSVSGKPTSNIPAHILKLFVDSPP